MEERTAMLFCPPLPPLQLHTDVPVSIGRDKSCEFPLRKSDVSRRHAEIRFEGSHFVLHDLGSTNGSYLNGERVEGSKPLRPGDKIEIGSSTITFCQVDGDCNANTDAPAAEQTLISPRPPARDAFQGELAEMPPFALLQVIEMGGKTGLLETASSDERIQIWFSAGKPVHAESEKHHGFEAALQLVNATRGQFRFESQPCEVEPTIEASVTELLLEAMRLTDEHSAAGEGS